MQLTLTHAQGRLHRWLEPDQGRIVPLGLIQCQYGLLQQLIRVLPFHSPGYPETTGKIEAALPGHELELQQAHHGVHLGFEAGLLASQDHCKFVPPQPVSPTGIGLPQPGGDRLQQAIAATGAERVFVTHGSVAVMVRWLREQGLDAQAFATEYGDEDEAAPTDAPTAAPTAPEADAGDAAGGTS